MHEKLITKVNERTGMLIGAIGFFIALIGAALAFTILPAAGGSIATVGILLGLLGGVVHFAKNWREIFHVDRQ